jgi:hypothetical protein
LQARKPRWHVIAGAGLQEPLEQALPVAQALPQVPQWKSFQARSMQTEPPVDELHVDVTGSVPAGQLPELPPPVEPPPVPPPPVPLEQVPFWQDAPLGQELVQLPQ